MSDLTTETPCARTAAGPAPMLPRRGLPIAAIKIADTYQVPADLRSVFFDLNGTLSKSEDAYRAALQRAVIALCREELPPQALQQLRTAWHMSDELACRTVVRALRRMLPGHAPSTAELLDEQRRILREERATLICDPVPGAPEMVQGFRDMQVKLGLVTGSAHDEALLTLQPFGWHDFFRPLISAKSLPDALGKPNPEPYLTGLREHGFNPPQHRCLAVENSAGGVLSAYQAGLDVLVRVTEERSRFATHLRERARAWGVVPQVYSSAQDQPAIFLLPDWGAVRFPERPAMT